MNSVNKHLFIHLMCPLGLDMMPGAEYLEVSGNVYTDVSRLGVGFCETHILMLAPPNVGISLGGGCGGGGVSGYEDFEKVSEGYRTRISDPNTMTRLEIYLS